MYACSWLECTKTLAPQLFGPWLGIRFVIQNMYLVEPNLKDVDMSGQGVHKIQSKDSFLVF